MDDLYFDETLSDDVYKVYTFDLSAIDMDERFADGLVLTKGSGWDG